jgi:hypothetical protein
MIASQFFGNVMLGDGALLRFAFSTTGLWITLVTTLVFGWLASRIPAQRAIRVSTRESLAYEWERQCSGDEASSNPPSAPCMKKRKTGQ